MKRVSRGVAARPPHGDRVHHLPFMMAALEEARRAGAAGEVPVGAVVVLDDAIVGRGHNRPIAARDPTAHAEVVAIRQACQNLGHFQLTDCDLYLSCEPCPMCVGAVYWARPARVFFAASRSDAAAAGFDDAYIYEELHMSPEHRQLPMARLLVDESSEPFTLWREKEDRLRY